MRFQRVTAKVLPNGETSIVYPFHICTLGQEDRIIFRTDEDLRVAHNYLPICARRSNVIIITDCVLNTHIHAAILAKSMKDAERFIKCYKISTSMFLSNKYDFKHGIGIQWRCVFFTKVLGMTDDEQMDQMLIYNHIGRKDTAELISIIEEKCVKRYGQNLPALTEVQKIPIIKSVFYSTRASPGQLARCFGISKIRVESILNKR